jgi:hypothetical protein
MEIDFLGFYANGFNYKFWEETLGNLSFNTDGVIYFQLSKDGKVLNSSEIEFPLDLINQYATKK